MPPTTLTIEQATSLCRDRGLRLTAQRKRVLAHLLGASAPLKAYEIVGALGDVKPMTVYRALDFLTGAGLAHRIESLNAYVAAGKKPGAAKLSSFMICDECGQIEPLDDSAMAQTLRRISAEKGFSPAHESVEIHGLCRDCA